MTTEVSSPDPHAASDELVLRLRNLTVEFERPGGALRAVDGVSLELRRGETLGLVGESGCGKSVMALSICRLLAEPPARIAADDLVVDGQQVQHLTGDALRSLRGRRIGFIFQDPVSTLNPVLTIGEQLTERMREHLKLTPTESVGRAVELLRRVGIAGPRDRMREYPHQLSGGMRQRVVIAMAISCDPSLLIADEPTTALDVTIQAQILDLLAELSGGGMGVMLITHDFGVAARMCDRIQVMYAGRIVEAGPVDSIYRDPKMPYTRGLLQSVARLDVPSAGRLPMIHGSPPDLTDRHERCRFAPRCDFVREVCRGVEPMLSTRSPNHVARCWGTEVDGWIK